MRIGYLKNLGTHELNEAKKSWLKSHTDDEVELISVSYDDVEDEIKDGELDAALIFDHGDEFEKVTTVPLGEVAVMAVIQAGNFDKHQQIVEVDELKSVPCMLIAAVEDERAALDYHKNVLGIESKLLAVGVEEEAMLLAESGSGYFLMNELTADKINDDQLQKMFLFKNGQQLKQKYELVVLPGNEKAEEFGAVLKDVISEKD